jgi:hypothetical protein
MVDRPAGSSTVKPNQTSQLAQTALTFERRKVLVCDGGSEPVIRDISASGNYYLLHWPPLIAHAIRVH